MTDQPNLLAGAAEIAECFYGVGDSAHARRIYKLMANVDEPHRFPMFFLGRTLCARRSDIEEWIAARSRAANDRNRPPRDAA